MAFQRYDQNSFTQGELDPRVYARTDWENYYKGCKQLRNSIAIPQGGIQHRWGTEFVDFCTVVQNNFNYAEIQEFIYNNNVIYLTLWEAGSLKIYLENILITNIVPIVTQYAQEDIPTLRFTQIETRLIINTGNFQPQQLVRSADAAQNITAFDNPNSTLTANVGYNAGQILPVQFATTGALPTTQPQIYAGRDYFIKMVTGNTFQIFSSSTDAANDVNAYAITALGVNSTVIVQNTWTLSNITFTTLPAYDFTGGYFGAGFTFTPSAVSGNPITLTASGNIFTAAMVGGLFTGNGGIVRLTVFTDATHMNGFTIEAFPNTNAIPGSISFLGEPAWSTARGWPRTGAFINNRLVQGGTALIPNGVWLSVVNNVYNFDDSQDLADDAIASYPASGTMSYLQSMTAARSLIVHTTDGNYSSPVQTEQPMTPSNFVLTIQNKFGVGTLQPVFIDNQVIFVDSSGNNIINMIWEFTQSSYVTNSISIKASGLIRNPVDMAAFAEPNFVDGFYVLFVNNDGTLAVLQTLNEEDILAYSLSNTSTYIANDQVNDFDIVASSYLKVVTAQNRCWFLVERTFPVAQAPVAIVGFTANTLQANAHGMTVGEATQVTFTAVGAVPTANPLLNTTQYFWAVATDANNFMVYDSAANATANTNAYTFTDSGVMASLVVWARTNRLVIEEIDFNFLTDMSKQIKLNVPATVITGLDNYNGMVVQIVADGYVVPSQTVFGGQITLQEEASIINIGLEYDAILVPLPPTIPLVPGMLMKPRHIRDIYIHYYNTIGATIQGFGIPVIQMQQVVLDGPDLPQTGVFDYTLMEGWEGPVPTDIMIVQSQPLPMTILGLSYNLEV
jgi:hypothetical protein